MKFGASRIWFGAVLACAAIFLAFAAGAGAAPRTGEPTPSSCRAGTLETSGGCVSRRAAQRHLEAMVEAAMPELGLRATIMRVDTGEEPLVNAGFGNSMKGCRPRRGCTSGSARSRSLT
jgi:hypothetical protein